MVRSILPLLTSLVFASPAAATVLYELDFDGPGNVLGSPPPVDLGPFPRSGVSGIDPSVQGNPLIANGEGPLAGSQVLRFERDAGEIFSTVETARFELPERITGFDPTCPPGTPPADCVITDPALQRYTLEFDLVVLALGSASGFSDHVTVISDYGAWPSGFPVIPASVEQVRLLGDGTVRADSDGPVVGSFQFDTRHAVSFTVDYLVGEWFMALDGAELHRAPLISPNLVRFRLTGRRATQESAWLVDDVRITAVPEPGGLALASIGVVTLALRAGRLARSG